MLLPALLAAAALGADPPAPLPPLPAPRQLAWHERRFYAFVHFNMNTFTDAEWGEGREEPDRFAPTALDCGQWARVCRAAGMTGIILTAKHHDGFCLWPSATTDHTVAASSWRGGEGDVLAELSAACRAAGLGFGVYLSPWDRNHPAYGDSPRYNQVFVDQLREVLTGYGPTFEVWFDGACGEGPNGKRQEYDWPRFVATVRELQPEAVIFSDAGPDVRWVGNERGFAGETNWCLLRRDEVYPGYPDYHELVEGHADGTHWVPAECDVSIRPGWYYHADQDGRVKSVDELVEIWYGSVGRNANLLLNLPVDRRGLVHETDVERLLGMRAALDATFAVDLARGRPATASAVRGGDARFGPGALVDGDPRTFWALDDGQLSGAVTVELEPGTLVDQVLLAEQVALGQRVRAFSVHARVGEGLREVARGTTIGARRVLRFPALRADALQVRVEDARACPTLAQLEAYCAPPRARIEAGAADFVGATAVTLAADQPGAALHYTTDGSAPSAESPRYAAPFEVRRSCTVRAVAVRDGARWPVAASLDLRAWSADDLLPALHLFRAPAPGLTATVYEGGWQSLDDLPGAEPAGELEVELPTLDARPRDEHFALVFDGYLRAPADGVWRFRLSSDDGSRLYVDGERVVDNDGLHGMQAREGAIGLAAGWHRFRLEVFNATGGAGLGLSWSGPGVEQGPIPPAAYGR